jgi:hypothetical protein
MSLITKTHPTKMFRDDPVHTILDQLCQAWGLDEPLRRRFIGALSRARWTTARDWYRAVQLTEVVGDRRPIAETQLAPAAIVKIVEALVAEGRFERWWASQLEKRILRCTDAAGRWK